jgi:hypothetical protein
MSKQTAVTELVQATRDATPNSGLDDEFLRRYREEFDRAERAKAENKRRLEARLAELRAQRAAL